MNAREKDCGLLENLRILKLIKVLKTPKIP
jgi:hypothetical protein